ncbi:efflux RND transporter permease subunit [Stakelama pacifica]|uniref:Hydrophobe/amphiphile efflux-1 (HAE1) family protein n=1 Tax=Stakelama pacifica TaxID=517720 RepID=A0A4V3BUC3_9SPHN|nr:efflux RND transporter permease subunit [Stakelama pacifica]TDN86678.1 hydrophobe/amphiphile efflux-1 (HAE1) family protein [Stakelama pacifica]GGO90353.1 multidrug transporter AcrB [Stakelama pacifica]
MSDRRTDLPMLAVKRPWLIAVCNLLIIIAGAAAIFGVEVRELPDVDRPIVSVSAQFPGAAPETMDAEVTSVLENAAARVSGVRRIRSSSEENNSRIRVEFSPGVDLDTAATDVREAVSRVTRDLPERVEQVRIVKADEDAEPIIRLAISSRNYGEAELTRIIDNDIVPELLTAQGVASIAQFGAREQQMRVAIDPIRLNRYRLTVGDVAQALRQAPFDVPAGSFRSDSQELVVRAEAIAATPDKVEDVRVRDDVRVGDIANVYLAPANASSFVRLNREPIIGLGVIRQAGSNTIRISDSIQQSVERLKERFPDISISVISDEAEFIRISVKEVIITLFATIAVVMATILLFFRSFRATLIPSTTIPVALIGVIGGIWLAGFSINLLTLLALVLATGLIVDDAIVVLENAQRLQAEGMGRRSAAVLGTRQVFFAVVATTAVLVSVFVPISFLPSDAGQLFREFGFVLALAVIISGFVALSLVPAIAARTSLTSDSDGEGRLVAFGRSLNERYKRALDWSLGHPVFIIVGSIGAAALASALYGALNQELVPDEDRGVVVVSAQGPDGVGLSFMDDELDEIEARLQPLIDKGVIKSTFSIVGRYDPNRVQVTANLADWGERSMSQQEVVDALRQPMREIPGSRTGVYGRGSLSLGGGSDRIEVALTGTDYDEIYARAQKLATAIDTASDSLTNAEISYQPTQPQVALQVDRQRAAQLGVDLDEISATLSAMVGGEEIVDLNVGDQALPILLTSTNRSITSPDQLGKLFVRTTSGALTPLSSVTSAVEEGIAAQLDRVEQRRAIEVQADITSGTLGDAVTEIRRLTREAVGPDADLLLQGDAQTLGETSQAVLLTFGFALVIVFLVLVAQFESLTSGLVVMLTVPFALAAAILSLFLTGISLNIYSQIGLVMLIGLMAKNGVLIVEFADQLRDQGKSVREAIAEAAALRLRPIMMTLISTVAGAIPLIIASGAGAEARQSIGWVIFGGLGIASLFTLFLTPVLYLVIARFGTPRSVDLAKMHRELDAAEGEA